MEQIRLTVGHPTNLKKISMQQGTLKNTTPIPNINPGTGERTKLANPTYGHCRLELQTNRELQAEPLAMSSVKSGD